jgi:hypothetical protein
MKFKTRKRMISKMPHSEIMKRYSAAFSSFFSRVTFLVLSEKNEQKHENRSRRVIKEVSSSRMVVSERLVM